MPNTYHHRIMLLLCLLSTVIGLRAQESSLQQLQKQMYHYFATPDSTMFFAVTEQLKKECLKQGDEQLFYRAWGNQAIYESAHQQRTRALELAKEMKQYANDHDSQFGLYTATHVMATVYYKMESYDDAQENFLKAIDLLHEHFPGQSAAADYLELTKLSRNKDNDLQMAYEYGEKALLEPGVVPQHQVVALSMLCQIDALWGHRDDFNRHYEQRRLVRQNGGAADNLEAEVEVTHCVINEQYDEALKLAAELPLEDSRDRWMARIYHQMGDDAKAYSSLTHYIAVRDSIKAAEQGSLLNDYIVQLSQERLESERLALEKEADSLRSRYWYTLATLVVLLLAYVIWRRYKTIQRLESHNRQLDLARQAEQEARQEAEKALDVKREFLNNISHELRTPLNPITGFSDILATPGFELGADEREAMSQHIKESSKVLTGIIDSMIELSFYESKTSLPKNDHISPNIICQHITDELRPHCQNGVQMAFITELKDELDIVTDMQSTERVLRELLGNAIKFTEQGSIVLHCSERQGRIRFTVTDTGVGISQERREHLFEPFIKTDENVKTTGMGLSICRSIAKLLGGTVELDTDYTGGSRFVFEIPEE